MTNNLSWMQSTNIAIMKTLGLQGCVTNLGISQQTLSRWKKEPCETGDMESRGFGKYASDEAKEIARLKRELRDAQDAYMRR